MSEYNIEYLQTKAGLDTVMVNGYLLHSKYAPLQEAKQLAKREVQQDYIHILFGNGLGYIGNEIADLLEQKGNLIVVDPLFNQLKQSLKPQVNSIVIKSMDENKIKEQLLLQTENFERKIKVICSPNYDKLFQQEYIRLLKIVKDYQNTLLVNENTIRLFSKSWQENYVKNLLFMCEDISLQELIGAYTLPVIIASGGPSLTKQLPKLKEIAPYCIIISAGSTINSLLAAGIEPDYIVSIDGAPENLIHFKNLQTKSAKLVYSVGNYYKIQEEYRGERIAFIPMKEERLQNYIKSKIGSKFPVVFGGGSVANFALHIATLISSGPIAIIGQDLAYTNNELHAKNNRNSELFDEEEILNSRELLEIEGYLGDKVYTTYEYLPMKESFEAFLKTEIYNNAIYNCTEGGAKIIGMEQIPFVEFCTTYIQPSSEKVQEKNITFKHNSIKLSSFINTMEKELSIYKEMKVEIKIALKEVKATEATSTFTLKILKTLDKIDKKLKKNFNLVILERIADPLILDIMTNFKPSKKETKVDEFNRIYKQNILMYSGLLYVIEQTEIYVKEVIEMANRQLTQGEII
ncbi:6-hydroxymethylpterin diphosphokinase MptE-like protein [Metasolibacillus sp.]|uniref:motility associated factor glycosyltransferase family protein n=1 Tax=Metasolibacillus sp. TaxID=2703680 RepID=UPI0025E9F97F|nr:6-hydroxymethylpterin diphosphokinase MptE-like protein [Metasolibacillus sp.]MCT6925675.1 DUF115 domain-containing protein [Metasolibacillus sp.]MCT6940995.1 DUF115 domain-containing protein [Metasolibacillus sp.]